MSQWKSTKAKCVLAALLRIGWTVKRQTGSQLITRYSLLVTCYSFFPPSSSLFPHPYYCYSLLTHMSLLFKTFTISAIAFLVIYLLRGLGLLSFLPGGTILLLLLISVSSGITLGIRLVGK
jgi:hypothetical protein